MMLKGAGVTELSVHLGLAKSTVHNHVKTLEERQYLVESDGEYHLSLRFLDLGIYAKERLPIVSCINDPLNHLAESTGEATWVVVEHNGYAVNIDGVKGEHGIETLERIGMRTHLHYHAAGKAILAFLQDERVEEIIDCHGLPKATENTITERDKLLDELETIRRQEFALNDGEAIEGLRSIAAPIIVRGDVLGAILVAGPARRIRSDTFLKTLPEKVMGAANTIELCIEYQ
jgi:DNA-binding IclR family transcriptional regulator